jgi:hypothetical protein
MTTNTAAVDAMIHGRRADSTRRRQRVLTALDNAITDGAELNVTDIARRALLTELKRKSAHVNGDVAVSGVTVTARDRRW